MTALVDETIILQALLDKGCQVFALDLRGTGTLLKRAPVLGKTDNWAVHANIDDRARTHVVLSVLQK